MNAQRPFFIAARQKPAIRTAISFFLMLLLLTASAEVWAQDIRDLTTAELKQKIDAREKMLIIDARTSQEYGLAHLPGAINIPPQQFNSISESLPEDKAFPLVFYCRGYS
ncbi:MAG: rhodanese-like domain-containing protein [Desulfobulbaceae bacterium]|nr:rhodanese-like domain-containing protein [Desulfobulbaceae bacterium]